jgi:hypothetical protein
LNRKYPILLPILVGVVLYVVLGFALWLYLSPERPTQKKDFAQLMAQIAGGLALLFGLYFTWRRVEVSQRTLETPQDQQVTERFTRAIDQLGATDDKGKKKLEIRLGGIYALERIARDSERDHWPIVETLTTYLREHAPWPPEKKRSQEEGFLSPPDASQTRQDRPNRPDDPEPEIPDPEPDIAPILTVLGRRTRYLGNGELERLDLRGIDLRGADLAEAHLEGAHLEQAHLGVAVLWGAHLEEAHLGGAHLEGAYLRSPPRRGVPRGSPPRGSVSRRSRPSESRGTHPRADLRGNR